MMRVSASWADNSPAHSRATMLAPRFSATLRNAGPSLLFGLRMWAAVSLALYIAFWLELDNPYWAGASAAIVCQPQLGASLRKGWYRMIGTVIGAAMSVLLVACFPQDRALFLGSLAVWAAACALAATLLRNFASYAAALAGYTVAIIAGDLLGTVGGLDANTAFLLAVTRASEICIGIVCAGVVLAATDLGGARRRLAVQFADLSRAITAGITGALAIMGHELTDTQPVRREFIRRVVALDPEIDQTLGESARIRYHSPVLQGAVDGLFTALSGWRAIVKLHGLPTDESQREAAAVLENVARELQSASATGAARRWIGDPVSLYQSCETTAERLIALPAATPSLRLLADKTAEAFTGVAHALNGLALLVADPARPRPHRGYKQIRVPDWLPALVNAGRAFLTISAVALFWSVTGWPGGGNAITFATVIVLLLSPRAEQAYGAAIVFIAGALLDMVLAATIEFAVLPALGIETFVGFSLVLAVCLVPLGAFLAHARQAWQLGLFTAMTLLFVSILQPDNPMTYNPEVFYNASEVIVFGAGFAAISFRLLPPLSPAFRARRLLALALRDLRRLAMGRHYKDWQGLAFGRLTAMPEQATPLQRAQLLAALSAGDEIIRLRHLARQFGADPRLEAALAALAEGRGVQTISQLRDLNAALANDAAGKRPSQAALRVRSGILVLSQVLAEHAAYFDARVGA